MICDRLDPDALHPARLADTHAWAAWGLTRRADPHHLELAIPARHEDSYAHDLLREPAHRLQQPTWPSPTAPPLEITDRRIETTDGDCAVTLEILDLPWYLPDGAAGVPGDAVTVDRWPLIDEAAATPSVSKRSTGMARHSGTSPTSPPGSNTRPDRPAPTARSQRSWTCSSSAPAGHHHPPDKASTHSSPTPERKDNVAQTNDSR